jgi:hypothetical protein
MGLNDVGFLISSPGNLKFEQARRTVWVANLLPNYQAKISLSSKHDGGELGDSEFSKRKEGFIPH